MVSLYKLFPPPPLLLSIYRYEQVAREDYQPCNIHATQHCITRFFQTMMDFSVFGKRKYVYPSSKKEKRLPPYHVLSVPQCYHKPIAII